MRNLIVNRFLAVHTVIYCLSFLFSACVAQTVSDDGSVVADGGQKIDQKLLIGTWYVKQILIDGQEDRENFPVNNDELILSSDGSCRSIDRTFDMEDVGNWTVRESRILEIDGQGEKVEFEIIELTSQTLVTKMLTEDIDMVLKYSKLE